MNAREEFGDLWELVVSDMEVTADEYRDDGWETHVVRLEEVEPVFVDGEQKWEKTLGLVGTLPDDRYDEIHKVAYFHVFDEYDTYRAQMGDAVFLVLAMEDTDDELALLMPLFYLEEEAEEMLEAVREEGEMRVYLHPPDDDHSIVFEFEDPDAFFPEEPATHE